MKKILIALVIPFIAYSQEQSNTSDFNKKNEINLNLYSLVYAGTLQIGYERYLKNNQSIGFQMAFFDNISYTSVEESNYKSKATSIKATYNIYFSKNKIFRGFLLYPLLKYRFGSIQLSKNFDENGNLFVTNQNVDGFSMGFGLGYKWRVINDRMTLGVVADFDRDLSGNVDYNIFPKVESQLALNLGFTF